MYRKLPWCSSLLLFAGLACCSDGTTTDVYDALLFGAFEVAQVRAEDATSHPQAACLALRFDGSGRVFADVDGDGREDDMTSYAVAGDGTFRLGDTATQGVLDRAAEVLVSGTLAHGAGLDFGVAVRQARGVQSPLLSGYYTACVVGSDPAADRVWTQRALLQADGVSTLAWTVLEDSRGAPGKSFHDYVVVDGRILASDGSGGGFRYEGALRVDGDFFVLARAPTAGDPRTELVVAVRWSADAASDDFLGDYAGYAFRARPLGGALLCSTCRFRASADGAGGASWEAVSSDGGAASRSWGYAVSPEGLLTMDGRPFGALARGGGLFVGVDADAQDDGEIGLYVALRA